MEKVSVLPPSNRQSQLLLSRDNTLQSIFQNGIGVNINEHQTERDLDYVASAGFNFVRTDLFWSDVETSKGQYNWQKYDRLVAKLKVKNIHPLFILCYNNPDVYGGKWLRGISSTTEVKAFAKFASLAVSHFKAFNPIWEIYNEPNRHEYWEPKPDVKAYMNMAKSAIIAMQNIDSQAKILAPALGHKLQEGRLDYSYLEECLKQGLLPLVDGISIHPYVDGNPESVEKVYQRVKTLINYYNHEKRSIPIISSEWGYSSYGDDTSIKTQSDYLARMFLFNLSQHIPISIGYSLTDSDAPYYSEYEKKYGILKIDYTPKLAYWAIKEMNQHLKGKRFIRKLSSESDDYLLEFSDGINTVIAAWTLSNSHSVTIYGKNQLISSAPKYFNRVKLTQLNS
jgi:hypothetical protein